MAAHHMVLHLMPFCPLSRKVHFGVQEKGLPLTVHAEQWWRPSEEFLKKSPTGELPLGLHDGHILGNDYVIQEYLDERDPSNNLTGMTLSQRSATRLVVSWFDRIFYQDVYWTLFYERALKRFVQKGVPQTSVIKSGLQALNKGLGIIENWTRRCTYLNGYGFSWADIAGASHISCIDYLGDVVWRDFPGVMEWYMKIKSRPTFRTMLTWRFPGIEPPQYYEALDF